MKTIKNHLEEFLYVGDYVLSGTDATIRGTITEIYPKSDEVDIHHSDSHQGPVIDTFHVGHYLIIKAPVPKWLIDYLNSEKEETLKHIYERAEYALKTFTNTNEKAFNPEEYKEALFDLDMDMEPVTLYDWEEREHHNYDLGKYLLIERIFNQIKERK